MTVPLRNPGTHGVPNILMELGCNYTRYNKHLGGFEWQTGGNDMPHMGAQAGRSFVNNAIFVGYGGPQCAH
jgi:hypothetical protein